MFNSFKLLSQISLTDTTYFLADVNRDRRLMRPGLQTAKPAVVDVALRALTGMSMLSKSLR